LNHLLDHEIDLTHFDARFRNEVTCATAYPPAMLLKVVLFAYSQGFVSTLADDIAKVFSQLLFICDRQGLIGGEMFAIDGVKLPNNASQAKSVTRADFERHRKQDEQTVEPDLQAREVQRIERLQQDAKQIRDWLTEHQEDRKGGKGAIRKSNRTDDESAKMATSKGVIQGYTTR